MKKKNNIFKKVMREIEYKKIKIETKRERKRLKRLKKDLETLEALNKLEEKSKIIMDLNLDI